MLKIHPVLLAGGSGTRLWPLSRKSYPKQFSNLVGDKTLFQQSAIRLTSSEKIEFAPHITLTNSEYRFIVGEQLQAVGIDPGNILIEPEAKNTAPAILAATMFALSKDPEAVLLVAPSDHVIPELNDFHEAVRAGLAHIQNGMIVTFGITPVAPETGYGYIEQAAEKLDSSESSKIVRFVEKPNLVRAEKMLEAGNFLWNAGIFLFKANDMIEAFKTFAPDELKHITDAVKTAKVDLGFLRLNPLTWSKLKDVSIDYAIMEKAKNLVVVPYSSQWSDLGDWNAVWSDSPKDEAGNSTSIGAYALECTETLLRAESSSQKIVGLGLQNIIAIAMPDAVLVAHKNSTQAVKKVVDLLKTEKASQAEIFPKDHRPWGWFESLSVGNRFQVKRIFVKPGAALSLQSHHHRSEHWIVVEGTAKVTVDEKIKLISEGESIYIPLGAVHRMENPGKLPMILIEVQTGSYLGEDDIIRYEDIYKRD